MLSVNSPASIFSKSSGVSSARIGLKSVKAGKRIAKLQKSLGVHKILVGKIWFYPPPKGPK